MHSPMLAGALVLGLLATASAQGMSESYSQEQGPKINLRRCTAPGSCKDEEKTLTIDSNWRWVHVQGDYKNCYKGNEWVAEYCPGDDGAACAKKCQLEGVTSDQYKTTYGVQAIPNGVSMKLVNKHEYGVSVGSRLYMYEKDKYEMFQLMNKEFAFDAEMNDAECGINGAVYLIEMQDDGGKGKGNNQAGAKFGTGYCDAQCPHDMKFIDGEANIKGWTPNAKDKSGNMGIGHYGACCNEMDIWEANARAQALTPHPCSKPSLYRCEGTECGDNDKGERYKGVCDKDGCDFAAWRMGNQKFYGKGSEFDIDTTQLLTQVTQFVTKGDTDDGELVEIRRGWAQNGKVIVNSDAPHLTEAGCIGQGNSLSDDLCKSQNELFGDYNHFEHHGAHKVMGESLRRGHVLAISLWDDVDVSMMWLDSWFPRDKDKNTPGISRGPCKGGDESTPTYVRKKFPEAVVKYTNFAVGCIGCTTPGIGKGKPARKPESGGEKCVYKGGGGGGERRRRKKITDPPATRRRSTRRRKSSRRRKSTRRRSGSRRRKSSRRRRKSL